MIDNNKNTDFAGILLHDKESFYQAFYSLVQPYEKKLAMKASQPSLGVQKAHYDDSASELEAFARPLWGLAGACKYDETSIFDTLTTSIRKGLKEGTNTKTKSYWDIFPDNKPNQRYVEMAAIVVACSMSPKVFWSPLSKSTKQNIVNWLNSINQKEEIIVYNNWRFFRILVNTFLKNVNQTYSNTMLELDFNGIESYYVDNGWYQDGNTEQIDHYIAFAIHFYSLLYTQINPSDEKTCNLYKERAKVFAKDFLSWFSADGPALAFGRSLTYRFAHTGFWVAYVCTEIYKMPNAPVSLEEAKGLIIRNLEYWLKKPIFDNGAFLTVGYGYPNHHMSESYNAPGSPYWAVKSFQILSLPKNHSFWKVKAAPLPIQKENRIQPISRFIFSRTKTGDILALGAGQYAGFEPRHHKEKYAKFAYSPHFGFTVTVQNEGLYYFSVDNTLGFSLNGVHWIHKGGTNPQFAIHSNYIYNQWSVQHMGITVRTILIPISGNWHLRFHKIIRNINVASNVYIAEGGFSTPYHHKACKLPVKVLSGNTNLSFSSQFILSKIGGKQSSYDKKTCALLKTQDEQWSFYSGVWDLSESCTGHIKFDEFNTNIISPRSVTPVLCSIMNKNKKTFRTTLVYCNRTNIQDEVDIIIPKVIIHQKKNSISIDNREINIKEGF